MSWITAKLHQKATYWAPSGNDGFGNATFSAPSTINCRWEERTDLFIDAAGKEARSHARVYVDTDVEINGYLYLGISSSTAPEAAAHLIKDFRKIPDLNAINYERRVML